MLLYKIWIPINIVANLSGSLNLLLKTFMCNKTHRWLIEVPTIRARTATHKSYIQYLIALGKNNTFPLKYERLSLLLSRAGSTKEMALMGFP